ncbi:hypothetical protein [Amycolatopsis sp. NPDC051061]|uniref:hypothetical protein n=1 Tax=Amycolatopsis sp. NPDC051061 TaxID=3155042 RepID=UPI00342598E7
MTALGPLVTAGTGRLALVSSSAVTESPQGWEHYAEAKRQSEAAVEQFVRDRANLGGAIARPPRLHTAFLATFGEGNGGQPVDPVAVRLLDHAVAVPTGTIDVLTLRDPFDLGGNDREGRGGRHVHHGSARRTGA